MKSIYKVTAAGSTQSIEFDSLQPAIRACRSTLSSLKPTSVTIERVDIPDDEEKTEE